MTLRALIIDDEPLAHTVILEYVKDVPYIEIVGQCYLATASLVYLNEGKVDLIFLDINMPKLKGLDFLRTLQEKPIVIITSAYGEYALESFELAVCDYLLKPFRFDRFIKATNMAFDLYQLKNNSTTIPIPSTTQQPAKDSNALKELYIKSDKKLIQVQLADIYYLESYGNYVKIWMENEYLLTPGTLSNFEDQLPSSSFFRIHKSYIIHRPYINYIEGNVVKTTNGKALGIGKLNRQAFRSFLGR